MLEGMKDFNINMETIKNSLIEMSEIKNTASEVRNSWDGYNHRLNKVGDKIIEPKIDQYKHPNWNTKRKK